MVGFRYIGASQQREWLERQAELDIADLELIEMNYVK